jgi:IclR family pca regulon transcriptional regulator
MNKTSNPGFEDSRDYVQSLARGLSVLRVFSDATPSLSLARIAARAGLSRAAARRLVLTLEHVGYLQPVGRGYGLSPRVLDFGHDFLGSFKLMDDVAPLIQHVADLTGWPCVMAVLNGKYSVCTLKCSPDALETEGIAVADSTVVARADSRAAFARRVMESPWRASWWHATGLKWPAQASALGRMLLSGLSDPEIELWLAQRESGFETEFSVTDTRKLLAVIQQARTDGYCYIEREFHLHFAGIAVPVYNTAGKIVAAIGTSREYSEKSRDESLRIDLPRLRAAAARIGQTQSIRELPPVKP